MRPDDFLHLFIDRKIPHRILPCFFGMGKAVHLEHIYKKPGIMPVIQIIIVKKSACQKHIEVAARLEDLIEFIRGRRNVKTMRKDRDLAMGQVVFHLPDSVIFNKSGQAGMQFHRFFFAQFHLLIIQCYNIFMRENIVELSCGEKQIYLVKTAHVSKSSVEDVNACVNEIDPDSICIELDEQRYQKLKDPEAWRETDIVKIIKDKQVGFLMVNLILSSFQKRMASSLGSTSGAEMIEGIRLAEEKHKNLVLADRPIKTTFSRIWAKLQGKEKVKLLTAIIGSIFEDEEISEEDLAKLKEADALEAALLDISKEFPTVKEVLVDERDKYLAQKIKTAPGNKVVAIIGAAHAAGIARHIEEDTDLKALETVEKKKGLSSYIKYLIPAILVLMIAITIFNNRDLGLSQIRSWILWNGSLSALGVLLALGHPLSILTAFVMSPITSLNPLLAAGWFAGLVEAYLRKPKVKDFEDLSEDTASFKGFWKNRVTRTLMVVIFANLFSSIGTLISGIDVVAKFIESL